MYFHIVWKHIKCLPCNILIDVRKFSTTQGADTPEDKALQDHYIESRINNHQLLGFPMCPKCKKKAAIVDPPEPKPEPPRSIDIDAARRKYQALLEMRSVAQDSIGKYPTFGEFCDYLRINHVQVDFHKRERFTSEPLEPRIKRVLIAGENFKLDYAFIT